eukprot:SAG31_NODE_12391_length_945_cov_1.451537_2_plen_89_part_00
MDNGLHSSIVWADDCIDGILWNQRDIDAIVKKLGAQISRDYQGKDLIIVGLLDGVFMFFADLTRQVFAALGTSLLQPVLSHMLRKQPD